MDVIKEKYYRKCFLGVSTWSLGSRGSRLYLVLSAELGNMLESPSDLALEGMK